MPFAQYLFLSSTNHILQHSLQVPARDVRMRTGFGVQRAPSNYLPEADTPSSPCNP